MEKLIEEIEKLKKNEIGRKIEQTVVELRENRKTPESVFSELCFCLLTANSSAEMGIKVQKAVGDGFESLEQKKLTKKLLDLGYRFYNVRAGYIVEARKKKEIVWMMVASSSERPDLKPSFKQTVKECEGEQELREMLVDNIKGLGYKEASHFLRNLGFMDVAILDRHILRTLHEKKLIAEVPKTLDRKRYLKFEKELEAVCSMTNLPQGKLDFYLWYLKTGKVLK